MTAVVYEGSTAGVHAVEHTRPGVRSWVRRGEFPRNNELDWPGKAISIITGG